MATYCIFGGVEYARPLLEAIPPGNLIYLSDSYVPSEAFDGYRVVTDPVDIRENIDVVIDLGFTSDALLIEQRRLADAPLFLTNSLFETATEAAVSLLVDASVIGIAYSPPLFQTSSLLEAAVALQCSDAVAATGFEMLRGTFPSKEIEIVQDRVGLVSMRALAMVINEAAFALQEGVASALDIDQAMKLGTNYPVGPLAWGDAIGADVVVALLDALYEEYHEERYRASVLLRQMARAAKSFIPASDPEIHV